MSSIFQQFFSFISEMSYFNIALLMALESTCFPVLIPVETVIIPMGYLIFLGKKNLLLTLIACISGVIIGCFVNYMMARLMGRPLVYKYSKYLMIKKKTLEKWEKRFLKNSKLIIFLGRFVPIPAVKHVVTIPAGISKMNLVDFLFFNALGATVFSSSMLSLGYFFGQKSESLKKYISFVTWIFVVAILFISVFFIIRNKMKIAQKINKIKARKTKKYDN